MRCQKHRLLNAANQKWIDPLHDVRCHSTDTRTFVLVSNHTCTLARDTHYQYISHVFSQLVLLRRQLITLTWFRPHRGCLMMLMTGLKQVSPWKVEYFPAFLLVFQRALASIETACVTLYTTSVLKRKLVGVKIPTTTRTETHLQGIWFGSLQSSSPVIYRICFHNPCRTPVPLQSGHAVHFSGEFTPLLGWGGANAASLARIEQTPM